MAFLGAPINDMTGKISDNKGGGSPGGFEATTMAVGEEDTSINPPSSGGPDSVATLAKGEDGGAIDAMGGSSSNAPVEFKGGGAPLTGSPVNEVPATPVTPGIPTNYYSEDDFIAPPKEEFPVFTTAFGEDGNSPTPALPDFGTENIEGGPAVLPGFDPTNVPVAPDLENPLVLDPNVPFLGATRAIGEDGNGPSLIDSIGAEPTVTTQAIGEEGDMPPLPGLSELKPNLNMQPTTLAEGEEDGGIPGLGNTQLTTMAVGEEDGQPLPGNDILQPPGGVYTTEAMGEEEGDMMPPGGGQLITQAMYEDGMPTPPRPPQPQPFQPQPPTSGAKGGGMQPYQPQPFQPYQPQPYQPQPFQPYQPVYQPPPPMYGGSFYGGGFGSPYGGGFGGGYGMQRPQPFGGNFYGNPYTPPPPPTPYGGGGKGGGFGQQQAPMNPITPQMAQNNQQPPAYNQQPMGKGGGQPQAPQPEVQNPVASGGLGLLGNLGAGSLLGGQQNTGGSSNNASPFGGSSGGGSRTAMF